MHIKVLGSERCSTCTNLKDKIEKIATDNGLSNITVEKVTDVAQVMGYGVMSTPGIVIDEDVKCAGRIPTDSELKDWLGK